MNDPDRKIDIDKSSLLSLKAELLRKQEEVSKAKATSVIEDFVPKRAPKSEKDAGTRERRKNRANKDESKKVTELEDAAQLARSKQVLQAKAKYYDRMVASGGALNTDENSLVMFNKKKQDNKPAYPLSEESDHAKESSSDSSDDEGNSVPAGEDDGWVEYVDCLGRTRKCLKEELELCLERDKALAKAMEPREGQRREDLEKAAQEMASNDVQETRTQHSEQSDEEEEGEIIGPMPSMAISDANLGAEFREMREQWQKQEDANLQKDSIHYQDVLFDEAREHGVGYYAFSTDQEERARQREELDSIRDATVEAQKERERLRIARDKMIADRVKAAKARQRARQGLPPEEEDNDEDKRQKESELYDTSEEQRIRKAEEKQRKKKEKEERKRERERAQHVRPWDEGKEQSLEDKEWVPAKERFILSQHEWNDLKRSERIAEFAPPVERPSSSNNRLPREAPYRSQPNRSSPSKDASESESDSSTEDDSPIVGPMPPPVSAVPAFEDIPLPEEEPNSRSLFFTTKKNPAKRELKRRNLDVVVESEVPVKQIPVPIRNELLEGGDHYDGMDSVPEAFEARGRGAEIEPPPTYEYYGPPEGAGNRSSYLGRAATSGGANLAASIEAGLKFLRNQSDKSGGPGTKNRWSSNADY
uniref:CCDC174 alpha/beta GRSR domain-containing protein n=1 Tax=Anopheles darlingi TaxID=43151 RepID=A0A2K6VB23_ANODA